MTTEIDELEALGDAIADTSKAAAAVAGLREELTALGAHVAVHPALWADAVRAQRQVEAVYLEIHEFVRLQAMKGLR
jgi:hypothetical protein